MSQLNAKFAIPSRVESLFRLTLGESTIPGAGRGLFVFEPVPSQALIFKVAKPLICIVCTVNLLFQPIWIVLANHCTFCRSRKTRLLAIYAIIALDTREERSGRLGMKTFKFFPALLVKSCTIAPKSVSPPYFPSRPHNWLVERNAEIPRGSTTIRPNAIWSPASDKIQMMVLQSCRRTCGLLSDCSPSMNMIWYLRRSGMSISPSRHSWIADEKSGKIGQEYLLR